ATFLDFRVSNTASELNTAFSLILQVRHQAAVKFTKIARLSFCSSWSFSSENTCQCTGDELLDSTPFRPGERGFSRTAERVKTAASTSEPAAKSFPTRPLLFSLSQ